MREARGVLGAMLLLLGTASAVAAQAQLECQRCHGELELLRQHVPTLAEARGKLVLAEELAASAHGHMTCGECHSGFGRFPHAPGATTTPCVACHEVAEAEWRRGAHGGGEVEGEVEAATCTGCHTVHTVASLADLREGPALARMNETCTSCHETQRLPPDDPHRDPVGCFACHAPHEVRPPTDPRSPMSAHQQAGTCGACHEGVARLWLTDVHGQTLAGLDPADGAGHYGWTGPPTCSTCHGAHPTGRAGDRGFSVAAVERCIACHEHAGRTFFGSYHGKATALGSRIVATCADCHSAHQIFPAADPRSTVAQANLVETCRSCHSYARPAFVLYDSHPEPFNRERNPYIFYSFWFMNSLLIGTLTVFGLHTLAWWIRILVDRRRGIVHGPGGGHA
jgi:predicted CXXCH cytochrome family protein